MGLHEKMIQLNQAVQKYTGKSGTTAVPDMIKRLTSGEATNLIFQKSDEIKYLTDYNFSSPIDADGKVLMFSLEVVNPLPERKIQPYIMLKQRSNPVGGVILPVRDFKQNEKATLTTKYVDGGTFDRFYLVDLKGDFQHQPKFYNLKVYCGDHIETSSSGNFTTVKSALSALGDAVRHAVGKSNLMTIDDMIALLGGTTSKDDTPATEEVPSTEEVLLYENNNFNYQPFTTYNFTLNGDSRFLHPYKLKFKFHTVSSSSGSGSLSLFTRPSLNSPRKRFTISDGDQDHEIVFDIPKGTASATYIDSYIIYTFQDFTITTMAIYAIFP